MFEKSVEILTRRKNALESRIRNSILTGHINLLSKYYESAIDHLDQELTEAKRDIERVNDVKAARMSRPESAIRYFRSLSYKLVYMRNLLFVIERDILPSEAAISQSLRRPEHRILSSLIEEATVHGPTCILSISDEYKCWDPGEPPRDDKHHPFSFVSLPDSDATSPLMYPIVFHEVGHASLSLVDIRSLFRESRTMLDDLENEYDLRISSAGARSKRIVTEEWLILDQWRRWAMEFYCDCFASLIAGPAYLTSMVHHFYGADPYDFWHSHPPLRLRSMVVQAVLEKLHITIDDVAQIDDVLDEHTQRCGFEEGPKFKKAADSHMIESTVNDLVREFAGDGHLKPGSVSSKGLRLINESWQGVLLGKMRIGEANDDLAKSLEGHYKGS